ncbi:MULTISPECIES: nitroreductase family protein [Crocosphaera]|uniref:Nitroreductase n=4 Tax=Crocosphaera watsonii TaxID=263511 RepID=G5JAJ3_CROWT|nr:MULTISPECIES: nitroreductase family protein [Crocosphaera]EHJ10795.1 Nitroreductase [Crocosphaera watsonii WH 0003]MCH2246621.1 nitroreductase family protein [Crocosphaera sp.]NQZ62749.1 nitroreductase family protein [Crocosphaera sp.]CCQ51575.1 Nitroreductase [Crocosphaera watsonii WH 8502]CCQ59111.1 Nitroreductase [Crocosphaera watsonii WH 0005]
MEKPADNQYPIHELIKQRWSPLAFNIRPVEPEKIASLLEAARWAASCFNEQPWFFIVATQDNAQEYEKLFSCLVEANQTWAKDAPLLMLSVAKLSFTRNNKPNRHALHDLGFAVGNLTLQAQALGLFVHQMGGFDADKARTLYSIPEDYEPVAAIAIGYPGNLSQLDEDLQQRELSPRSRKPLTEFVFRGNWNQSYF